MADNVHLDFLIRAYGEACYRSESVVEMERGHEEIMREFEDAEKRYESLRYERDDARARLERCIKILTRIHSFMTPEDVRLPDGRVMQFSNAEIEREMLRGLCAAIRAIPDELIAIDRSEGGNVADVIKGEKL